jgi:cytosine/adenosine deaminase-related metal-dependent hydrolase
MNAPAGPYRTTPSWHIPAVDQVPAVVTVIEDCSIATVDSVDSEYARGHLVISGDRISVVGSGAAPEVAGALHIDASGCLATPGLVNTHTHLNHWLTRGLAQQAPLGEWLATLYPAWSTLTADREYAAASAGLATLAMSGCSTCADHLYVVPRDGGDVFGAAVEAAARIGVRLHLARGSIDIGPDDGGLAPASIVEDLDTVLASSAQLISRHHDAGFSSMARIALAPTAPIAVSRELMRATAELARESGVRLHTHAAETDDEDAVCHERFGCGVVDYLDQLGWLGADVWLAHGIHFTDDDITRLAATATGVAHCPSSNARLGAGIARVPELLAAGVPVGLGVDGAAANEAGQLVGELRQAMLLARARAGPVALSARQALRIATAGGARCLGRADEIGSLEVGKLADIALWRVDGLGHAGIADPIAALVFGPPAPLRLLLVGGQVVVEADELRTADISRIRQDLAFAGRKIWPDRDGR